MATCRPRGGKFEFKVTRTNVLPSPGYVYFTFDTEEAGRDYCKLLDKGVVPEELKRREDTIAYLVDAIRRYQKVQSVLDSDHALLRVQEERIGICNRP